MIRFVCDRLTLNEALGAASRVASGRPGHDGLPRSLHLEARGKGAKGSLVITGSDTDYSLVTSVEADVSAGGACLIDARIFSDIVRRLSGDTVEMAVDNQYQAAITCDASEFSIAALSAERYTAVPDVDASRSVVMPQPDLKRLIGLTAYAVSVNETRGVHTGVLFDGKPDSLTLVALDGHRMAVAESAADNPEPFRFVAHASPVSELERLLSADEEQTVNLEIGRRFARFDLGRTQVIARLLDGEFLQYENSLPAECTLSARVDTRALVQSIERVALLISDKLKNPVRLQFDDGQGDPALRMSCVTGLGKAADSLPVELEGKGGLEIGFNHRYLLDALRRAPDERVELRLNGPLQPLLMVGAPDEDGAAGAGYRYLILPVRLNME
ncbi:MAG: DNA polymerase III subunit beta [Oscillospiraceae bacterium]|nr:DNA polymerase III subunit beta [Oscillospiraceae bacterium]